MATTVYVNTDNTGTKDGTTFANGYDNLQDAVAAQAAANSDRTGDGPLTILCGGATADTVVVNIVGFTTTASDYIEILPYTGYRHAGVWDTGKYRLSITNGSAAAMAINESFVRIDGLQIENVAVNAAARFVLNIADGGAAGDIRISNCILKSAGSATYGDGPITSSANTSGTNLYIWNTILYGGNRLIAPDSATCAINGYFYHLHLYNCTSVTGGYAGIRIDGATAVTMQNCYVRADSSTYAYAAIAGSNITCTNCATFDGTADDFGGSGNLVNIAFDTTAGDGHAGFVSVTPGNADFLKLKSDSWLVGRGSTVSDDPPGFTTDIAGTTRS